MIKVTTRHKKSIVEVETYERVVDGTTYRATLENVWRWGHAIIDASANEIDVESDLIITDYSIEDQQFDDGTSSFWYFDDSVPEPIQQELEAAWEENWMEGIEELGWYHVDTETTFVAPLDIEELDEEPKAESAPADASARKWPF